MYDKFIAVFHAHINVLVTI